MIKKTVICTIFTALLFTTCKPYNSSEANKDLLQGKWHLVDIRYTHKDSLQQNILKDSVLIKFYGDSVDENINGHIRKYSFKVKNYSIAFQIDSSRTHYGNITSLSKDTFRMKSQSYDRIYIKEE